MKYKIIYNGPLYIEVEADNEDERKEAIKGIMYSIDTFTKNTDEQGNYVPKSKNAKRSIQTAPEADVLASDRQIGYMCTLGITVPENCTKKQAIALIHQYKRDHGIPDR